MRAQQQRRSQRRRRRQPRASLPGPISHPGTSTGLAPVSVQRSAMVTAAHPLKLNEESALYPGEGVQGRVSLQYSLGDFYKPVNWDQFRLDWIEVTARLRVTDVTSETQFSNLTQGIDVYSSFDPDDVAHKPGSDFPTPLDWSQWTERSSIGKVTVTPTNPVKKVMRFRPAALNPATPSEFPSVARLWSSNAYYDANRAAGSSAVRFGSLQIYAHCNNYNKIGNVPFTVDLVAEAKFTLRYGI